MVWNERVLDTLWAHSGHRLRRRRVMDWITAVVPFQHSHSITGGKIVAISPDGALEWETAKAQELAGSYDST
jgi:hypothetical protein